MQGLNPLKEFYQINPVDLSFLTHCSWRQFRFVLFSGRFWKIPNQINETKVFNSWLQKIKPLDVYYSTSCWLNPVRVGAKSEIVSENLFLFSDLVFDLDGKNTKMKSIEDARKESIKLLDFIDDHNFMIKYIAFSGSKGFHIVCDDPIENSIESPLEREEKTKIYSKEITQEVLESGIKIDSRVTVDTRRIIRVPGTINSKSGYCCRILTRKEIENNPAKEIVKNTKYIDLSTLEIPRGNDWKKFFFRKILGLHRFRVRSNPSLYYYTSFLSNKVTGTKLFVPIIEFRKTNETKIQSELITIMGTYKLSDAFLFKGDNYFAILPFGLQKRRVDKILSKADSLNLAPFRKYHQTYTRISAKIDMKMKELADKPAFIKHLCLDLPEKPVSAAHLQFLQEYIKYSHEFKRLVGTEEYTLRHTIIENH